MHCLPNNNTFNTSSLSQPTNDQILNKFCIKSSTDKKRLENAELIIYNLIFNFPIVTSRNKLNVMVTLYQQEVQLSHAGHVTVYVVEILKCMVTQNGTIRKLGYGFLFTFLSNHGRICSHFDTIHKHDRHPATQPDIAGQQERCKMQKQQLKYVHR